MAEKETKVLEADNKPKKAKKEKKKGRIKNAWNGFKSEFKKIVWSPRDQVRKNTIVVVVAVVALAIIIALADLVFMKGITALSVLF